MRLHPIAGAIGIALALLVSQSANALPNGKPFQELNALIEENATAIDENGDLIEQNSTAILALSTELSTLDGRVGVLETNVAGLTTRFGVLETSVATNTSDITLAFAKITSVQEELGALDTVVATNTQAITDAETAIAAAEADIDQLNTDLSALYDTVAINEAAITDVQADIAAAEARLSLLEADVITNAAEIQTTNDNLNDLNASLLSLQAIVDSNTARITQTESDIFDAQNNIATLSNQYNDLLALVGANADASDAAIAALKTELLALIAATEADIATNKADLQALSQDLLQMAQDNSAIAKDLRDQMLALALLVDSNSTSITALSTQVGTLSSTLTTLNAQYNSLSSLYGQLSDHVDAHHDELATLSLALSNLTNRVDLIDPDSVSNPLPLASYSFTDKYSVTNINNAGSVHQFFRDTETHNRWVYMMMSTPTQNKVSELCIKDVNDIFSIFKIEGDHNTNWVNSYSYGDSAYRLNNGNWTTTALQLRSRKDSYTEEVDIYASYNSTARVYALNRVDGYARYNETYHSGSYWTYYHQQDTTATYTVADDRLTACGY